MPGLLQNATDLDRLMVLRCLRPDRLPHALHNWFLEFKGLLPKGDEEKEEGYSAAAVVLKELEPPVVGTPLVLYVYSDDQAVWRLSEQLKASTYVEAWVRRDGESQRRCEERLMQLAANDLPERRGAAADANWALIHLLDFDPAWLEHLGTAVIKAAAKSWRPANDGKEPTGMQSFRCTFTLPVASVARLPDVLRRCSTHVVDDEPLTFTATVRRNWSSFSQRDLDFNTPRPRELRALLFGLTILHSLLEGRRRFGSAGWAAHSHHLDFHQCSDLVLGVAQVRGIIADKKAKNVDWTKVSGVGSHIKNLCVRCRLPSTSDIS